MFEKEVKSQRMKGQVGEEERRRGERREGKEGEGDKDREGKVIRRGEKKNWEGEEGEKKSCERKSGTMFFCALHERVKMFLLIGYGGGQLDRTEWG
jgi:hypothetical protein